MIMAMCPVIIIIRVLQRATYGLYSAFSWFSIKYAKKDEKKWVEKLSAFYGWEEMSEVWSHMAILDFSSGFKQANFCLDAC